MDGLGAASIAMEWKLKVESASVYCSEACIYVAKLQMGPANWIWLSIGQGFDVISNEFHEIIQTRCSNVNKNTGVSKHKSISIMITFHNDQQ